MLIKRKTKLYLSINSIGKDIKQDIANNIIIYRI